MLARPAAGFALGSQLRLASELQHQILSAGVICFLTISSLPDDQLHRDHPEDATVWITISGTAGFRVDAEDVRVFRRSSRRCGGIPATCSLSSSFAG